MGRERPLVERTRSEVDRTWYWAILTWEGSSHPPGHPAIPRLILYPGTEGGELGYLVWEQSHRGKTHTCWPRWSRRGSDYIFLSPVQVFQVALVVKNPPANTGDIRNVSLIPESGRSLEEGMATYSNILAWRISWAEEPGGLSPQGHTELDTTEVTYHVHTEALPSTDTPHCHMFVSWP